MKSRTTIECAIQSVERKIYLVENVFCHLGKRTRRNRLDWLYSRLDGLKMQKEQGLKHVVDEAVSDVPVYKVVD